VVKRTSYEALIVQTSPTFRHFLLFRDIFLKHNQRSSLSERYLTCIMTTLSAQYILTLTSVLLFTAVGRKERVLRMKR